MLILRSGTAAVVAATLALVGCEGDKPQASAKSDAGAEAGAQPVLDSKLEAAVAAAAASASAKANAGPAQPGAPPESGVFAPGQADIAFPRNAPTKIEVLSDGSEPRVALKTAAGEQKATVTVGVRLGPQQAMPTIEFELKLAVDKDKDKDKDKAAGGPTKIVAKVTSAGLAAEQPGALPKELAAEVKKLKGSALRFAMGPDGSAFDYSVERSKDADPTFEAPLRALVETVSVLTPALPQKPVGAGAYWMVTDRSGSFGVDVVRYRVFKVEKIDKDDVTLSVDCRQYAADAKMSIAMGPEKADLSVDRFESLGKGQLHVTGATLLPTAGELTQKMQALVLRGGAPAGPQGQGRMGIQTEVTTRIK